MRRNDTSKMIASPCGDGDGQLSRNKQQSKMQKSHAKVTGTLCDSTANVRQHNNWQK